MNDESAKVMFEIFRDAPHAGSDGGPFRVLYYTELDDDSREPEIARALAGEHLYDGFLRASTILHAKIHVERWLRRLNGGTGFDRAGFEADLGEHLV